MRVKSVIAALAIVASACTSTRQAITFQYLAQHPTTLDSMCAARLPVDSVRQGKPVADSSNYPAFVHQLQQERGFLENWVNQPYTLIHDTLSEPCEVDTAQRRLIADSLYAVLGGSYIPGFVIHDTSNDPKTLAQLKSYQDQCQAKDKVIASQAAQIADKEATIHTLTKWVIYLSIGLSVVVIAAIVYFFKVI